MMIELSGQILVSEPRPFQRTFTNYETMIEFIQETLRRFGPVKVEGLSVSEGAAAPRRVIS